MVMVISNKSAAAFKGKGARSPRTDTRNMYTTAMSLMGNIILYRITLPHTKDLGFTALVFASLEVKVFKHDRIDRMKNSKISNCCCNLDCQFVIQSPGVLPEAANTAGTIFSLLTLNSVQYMIQMVFFSSEVDKLSLEDSSICSHDAAHSIRVNAKVYRTDTLILYRGVR